MQCSKIGLNFPGSNLSKAPNLFLLQVSTQKMRLSSDYIFTFVFLESGLFCYRFSLSFSCQFPEGKVQCLFAYLGENSAELAEIQSLFYEVSSHQVFARLTLCPPSNHTLDFAAV